jgi:formylglycine-generating enzyme required for sulfatase activity
LISAPVPSLQYIENPLSMPDSPSLYTLLIGINDYESPSLRSLEFAVADVLEFGSFLNERARLAEDRCVKLISSAVRAEARPSRSRILAAFDRFAQIPMSIADTFILYFAGHAFAVEGETFLMACDSEPGSKDLLTASAVSLRALEPFLRRIRAGQQLLILDACRNEPHGQTHGTAEVKWDTAMTRDIQALAARDPALQAVSASGRHGRAVLSACWEGSVAFEFPGKRHSWFCYHVLEALGQVQQGPVEFTPQWTQELGCRMRESAPLLLPEAATQQPHLILDGSPIRLDLAPRRGLAIPLGPDPDKVVVQEKIIAPLQIERLETELATAQTTLKRRKKQDLTSVLDVFFEQIGDPPDFPANAWNAFEPGLLSRRYPWSDRQILKSAEQLLQDRRKRQKQEQARKEKQVQEQSDHDDWRSALGNPTRDALSGYLKRRPNGLHAKEAQDRIKEIDEDEAWQQVQQSSCPKDLAGFMKRFPRGRHASAAATRQADLRRPSKLRKVLLTFCYIGLAYALVTVAVLTTLSVWEARPERARQKQAEKDGLRKEGQLAVAGIKSGDASILDLGQSVTMELCGIPPGEFMMGSTREEREWAAGPEGQGKPEWFTREGETPRLTRVAQGFWLGRTEVTVEQWKRFLAETGYIPDAEKAGEALCFDWSNREWSLIKGKSWRDPNYGFAVRNEHPVACISWNDAMAFCKWLMEKLRSAERLPAGIECRLPTEAEWEYACRGGRQGTKFWWGDSITDGQGRLNAASDDKLGHNYETWSAKFPWSDGYAWVSPVNVFMAEGQNGFGLADMLGNVWEWCLDGYDEKGAHEQFWTQDTSQRVMRGGSFCNIPSQVRCAYRIHNRPQDAYANFGFRVCVGVFR